MFQTNYYDVIVPYIWGNDHIDTSMNLQNIDVLMKEIVFIHYFN